VRCDLGQRERGQLDLFRAIPRDLAVRDAQDLMAYPFFSLAKGRRTRAIDFRSGEVTIRVEAVPEHGMATIWDADVLVWAASHVVEARDAGLATSRLMAATPYEMLSFMRRGTSGADYARLKAALDRLQSTTIATSIRRPSERRLHRFSWINEWTERADALGRPQGIELVLPDWFYAAVLDERLVLTIDAAYFELTGGLERWLYRIVRKHGGRQGSGWRFDLAYLYQKSGSLAPFKRFAFELRDIVRRQALPGYLLALEAQTKGPGLLRFRPAGGQAVDALVRSGTRALVRSGTRDTCDREPIRPAKPCQRSVSARTNLDSNLESNFVVAAPAVDGRA
jgi:plasmid replication initiation protein